MVRRIVAALFASLLWLTNPAIAAWLPDGSPVCAPCDEGNPVVAPDGAGGVFVVWEATHIYAQHLAANGDPAPGWPTGGLPVCVAPSSQGLPAVLADGLGGFFVSWTDFRNNAISQGDIYAQHVRGDGSPAWPVNGVPVTQEPGLDNSNSLGSLAPDGSGGLFVIWGAVNNTVWAQHLGATGTPAPGWPSDGFMVCSLPSGRPMSITADGTGGAVLAWTDARRGGSIPDGYDVYGQRFTAQGTLAPGWVPNGLLLGPGEWKPILLPDGAGGFFMTSANPSADAFDANYYVRRFTLDATAAPGWPASGVVACVAPDDRWGLLATSDSLGGVLLDWYDYRTLTGADVYGSRVLPTATLAPGWPASGLRVSDPGQPYEFNFGLAPDGAGGAYMSWDTDGGPSYIHHIAASGTIAPGWPPYGFQLATTCAQFTPQVVPDGVGGAIAVWEERDGGCSRNGLFAQRFAPGGPYPVPVQLSLAEAQATPGRVQLSWQGPGAASLRATVERRAEPGAWLQLGAAAPEGSDRLRYDDRTVQAGERYAYRLSYEDAGHSVHSAETWVDVPRVAELALMGLRPNPATTDLNVAFSLPSAAPATLELLDVGGRTVLTRPVGDLGAGRHLLRLTAPRAPRAGLYWLRLRQNDHTLTTRGIVVH